MKSDATTIDVVDEFIAHVENRLGTPSSWSFPGGYPGSLALCVIDSIQSIGVRYGSVQKVVERYRAHRDADAGTDSLDDLRRVFAELGGVEGWTRTVGNRHKTSTAARASLKGEVILRAATRLPQLGVTTTEDLRSAPAPKVHDVKAAWLAMPGQRSGISWRYLLMLAGVPGVKPDRMIRRFVETSSVPVDPWMSAGEVAELVEEAARRLQVSASALDHAIWLHQSGRKASKPLDRPDNVPAALV